MAYLSVVIEDDQLKALEALKAKKHDEHPEYQISLSSIVRSVLGDGLAMAEKRTTAIASEQ